MLPEWAYPLISIGFIVGIFLLALWIGKHNASNPKAKEWETIRYYLHNPDYRIPQWIQNKINHADLHALALKWHGEGLYWYLRGKYYEYNIYAQGQSGTDITIRRHKIH